MTVGGAGRRRAVLLALLLFVSPAAQADQHADPDNRLDAAREAFTALRWDDALHMLDAAWRAGGSSPERLREIFALAGQAAASTGDDEGARLWFQRWLVLDADAALPAGTSPKLTAPFAAARDALAGGKLDVTAREHSAKVTARVAADPLALAAAVRAGEDRASIADGRATLPAGAREIEVLDRFGNVLARVAVERELHEEARRVPPPNDHPLIARWQTWAITAGGLAVVGGAALWIAADARSSIDTLNASSGSHEYAEAESLQTRFDRAQWVSRFAFGGAAAAAIVGIVMYVRGHHDADAKRAEPPLAWRF